ncbi:MAG TPA: UDP-glucose/GDP-mannose dehydrogenase family protein [Terriglobales bacterium]|nr:UDP-glucose/GDP-mannose dehydrogenase family protein [Terriglobales bacterium]
MVEDLSDVLLTLDVYYGSDELCWHTENEHLSLSISVFGLGYVGSVSAACWARAGHRVTGVDVNSVKVEMLASGRSPILELGMSELVAEGHQRSRLCATTEGIAAVHDSDISFVCVGTPSRRNGKLDLSHIEHVACEIGTALKQKKSHHTVVLRSTLLPGTTESLVIPMLENASGRRAGVDFAVCYNPEFMREGSAVADFIEPPYIVLGAHSPEHLPLLREVYAHTLGPRFETTIQVAEMVKYASNVFHALKIGFANEMGTLCKHLGVDTETASRIFSSDTKLNISSAYLSPGFAFGGSCLPKDLRALAYQARQLDLNLPLLEALMPSNAEHLNRAVDTVLQAGKKKVSLLGLSFKAGIDDLRESPQVQLVKRLLGEGCQVRIWDQDVSLGRLAGSNRQYIEEVIPHIGSLLSADLEQVVRSAEVVIIGNKSVKKGQLSQYLQPSQLVLDLVNLDRSHRPDKPASYQGICW